MDINLIHLLNDLINEPCEMTSGRILYFKPCAGKTPGGRTKLKDFFRLLKFHIHRNHSNGGKRIVKIKKPVHKSTGRTDPKEIGFIRWFSCILQNRYDHLPRAQIYAARPCSFLCRNAL
jgi:hypothetical protein